MGCAESHPLQRYFQLNLVPLAKFGTVEFRGFSATYDSVRLARWVQLLVALVDYYGHGEGFNKMQAFWSANSADEGYAALQRAQREATTAELFEDLKGLVDAGSAEYFGSRKWEDGDPTCHPQNFQPSVESCDGEDPSSRNGFPQAVVIGQSGSRRLL